VKLNSSQSAEFLVHFLLLLLLPLLLRDLLVTLPHCHRFPSALVSEGVPRQSEENQLHAFPQTPERNSPNLWNIQANRFVPPVLSETAIFGDSHCYE